MRLRKKSLRLYVYHNRYQELEDKHSKKSPGILELLFNICYYTGLTVIYTLFSPVLLVLALWKRLVFDLSSTKSRLNKKVHNLFHATKWRANLALFLVFCILTFGSLQSLLLISEGQKIKGRVLGDANLGIQSLTAAGQSLQNDNGEQAQIHFEQALKNFGKIQTELENNGLLLNSIFKVVPQRQDANKLTEAARLATESGIEVSKIYNITKNLKFSPQGIEGGGENGQNIVVLMEGFTNISRKVNLITSLLSEVDPNIIPSDKRPTFLAMQSQLSTIKQNILVFTDLTDLISTILLEQKEVLVMFQNNNELRPTGGFLGTFGAMKLDKGVINKLHISSIYDLDGQLKELINPPRPMYAVNDRWFLRDSNWFFDFPTTAKKMIEFYEKEGGTTPNLVIALTPTIVTDLLQLTGPVSVPGYSTTLTSENFIEMTQLETSVKYDKKVNKPKQFLADFFPIFLQRISSLEGDKGIEVLKAFHRNLYNKEILLYANNEQLQNKIAQFNWSGQIKNTDKDYLAIVSANLGGTKSDLEITQEAGLQTEIDNKGAILNTLTITRENTLPDKEGLENISFIRILVPEGSELVEATGFSVSPLPTTITPKGYDDVDVQLWEEGSLQDIGSGTLIGKEAGKTFFGNWLILKGGEKKSVTIKYKIPTKIGSLDRYSMLFQKQPGVAPYNFTHTIKHDNRIAKWLSKPLSGSSNYDSMFSSITDKDQIYGLILELQ